jgi:hypothetical protein
VSNPAPLLIPKGTAAPDTFFGLGGGGSDLSSFMEWGDCWGSGGPGQCGPPGRVWADFDYLLFWLKNSTLPPLVTTSPAASAGILGPGTSTLIGDRTADLGLFSGFAFAVGFWANEQQTLGFEGGGLFLGTRSNDLGWGGNGAPGSATIARPFFNPTTNRGDSVLVNAPGTLAGNVDVHTSTNAAGGQFNGLVNLCCGCGYRLDMLAGFQYFQLTDGLAVTENLSALPTLPNVGGTTFAVLDAFDTANRFYGGQLGLRGRVYRGRLFAVFNGSAALGGVDEIVNIKGFTVITPPGGSPVLNSGGLLALPTNIGRHTQSHFAVLPQAGLDVGYRLTSFLYASVGYRFLYLSNVVRPGDQIDRAVNPTQLPGIGATTGLVGPARPAFTAFHESSFWAQGLQFGLELRF